jgi:nicotinate-nucleotide adenylyltransferase
MDIAELPCRLELMVDELLSPRRAAHSRGVAALSAGICARNGIDPIRGRISALAHDLCKELPLAEQKLLAAGYGELEPSSSLMEEKIIHGPAAAGMLSRRLGVEDEDILEAVAYHTIGREDMGELAIIVYCADKLEPGRGRSDADFVRLCLSLTPREMFPLVVENLIGWLERKGFSVAPETRRLFAALKEGSPA